MMETMPVLAQSLRHAGAYPALVLNADWRPLSSFPLSVWGWQDAVRAVFHDRVNVMHEHPVAARSQHREIRLPSVVALRDYVQMSRTPAFTRYNVLLRDQWCCAYCGHSFPSHQLTFDHVVPKSRGGKTCWENIVIACHACNGAKGNDMLGVARHALTNELMVLQWRPWRPSAEDLAKVGERFRSDRLPAEWYDYLGWERQAA